MYRGYPILELTWKSLVPNNIERQNVNFKPTIWKLVSANIECYYLVSVNEVLSNKTLKVKNFVYFFQRCD